MTANELTQELLRVAQRHQLEPTDCLQAFSQALASLVVASSVFAPAEAIKELDGLAVEILETHIKMLRAGTQRKA